MGLPPIKLRLDGDELHLVDTREIDRWGGFLNARRAAFSLVTPANVAALRTSLLVPSSTDSEGVFDELRKQLEDGSAVFFEVPPAPVQWDAPDQTELVDLIPKSGPDSHHPDGPIPADGLHWIEIVCISAQGQSYAGSKAQIRLPGGRSEFVTLDSRSSVRFDDLTDSGTTHFELSGDAAPVGSVQVPAGTRYEQGAAIGLVTRRRHVLIVHPNPDAFVSVELLLGGEPVNAGAYALTTKHGDTAGELDGEPARAEGFPLPSTATYAFEGVILPPRPPDEDAVTPEGPDAPDRSVDPAPNDRPESPLGPGGQTTPRDLETSLRMTLALQDARGEQLMPGTSVRIIVAGQERAGTADADGFVVFDQLEGSESVAAYLAVSADQLPPLGGENDTN